MLSLAPLSGLQAVIKRRNSKARRDSFSIVHSNLDLPGTIRRFSSSEAINSQLHLSAPSVATVSRISSFSRKIRNISVGNNPAAQSEVVDSCTALDLHIALIKRKLAEFREEDVDISERVEELSNTVSDLCLDYQVPQHVEPDLNTLFHAFCDPESAQPQGNSEDEEEEEQYQKFCEKHTYLIGNTRHLGYSTLPLPPSRGAADRMSITASAKHPKRSLSYEGKSATASFSHYSPPRNSYPQASSRHKYQDKFQGSHGHHRPLSYQDISYEENEESSPEGSWGELSCP